MAMWEAQQEHEQTGKTKCAKSAHGYGVHKPMRRHF